MVDDSNHALTLPFTVLDPTDLGISETTGNSILDRVVINYHELFPLKLHKPISANDPFLLLL